MYDFRIKSIWEFNHFRFDPTMPSDSFFDKVITHLVSLYCTLIGLRPFRMQDNKIQFSYIGTIYNILLITFYSFGIILALRNRFRVLLPKETHLTVLVDSFVLTANYLAVVITWYCCAFKQKFLHQLIWAWEDVQQLEKVLKIERFTSTRRNTITRRFLVVSFFWHLLNLVVSFSLTLCGGGKLSNIVKKQWTFWFLYTAVNSVNTALILVLLEIMWELRKSYRSLNRRIMKLTESSTKKLTFNYHIGFVANEPSISDILYLIGKLHRKLAVVAETTMKFARLPLLFSVGVCFGHTFLGIFGVHRYFYMQDSIRIPHSSVICSLFFPLQRMLLCNIVLIMICSLPQWTCDEV